MVIKTKIALALLLVAIATPAFAQGLVPYYNWDPEQRQSYSAPAYGADYGADEGTSRGRLRVLEAENARLRRAVSDLTLEMSRLKRASSRN
jgi:hypothetical protein